MGEPPRIPTLEIGFRNSDIAKLRPRWYALKRLLGDGDGMERWPVHNPEEFLCLLTRRPIEPSGDLKEFCLLAGQTFKRWYDYDEDYQIAQAVLMETVRKKNIKLMAGKTPRLGSSVIELNGASIVDVGIDADRKHFMPNQYGEIYPRAVAATPSMPVYYNVRMESKDLKASKSALQSGIERLGKADPSHHR